MSGEATDERTSSSESRADAEPAERPRRPYERPRIESGNVFERVQLTSHCNFADPTEGCEPVC